MHWRRSQDLPEPGGPYSMKFPFLRVSCRASCSTSHSPFTEDPDVWQKVWGATSLLLEEDALFVLPGHLGEGVSKGTALTSVLAKGDGAIPVQTPRRLEHVLHCG